MAVKSNEQIMGERMQAAANAKAAAARAQTTPTTAKPVSSPSPTASKPVTASYTPPTSYPSSTSSISSSANNMAAKSSYTPTAAPSTPSTPSGGYKTHFLESGGSVTVRPDGTIDQYGGKLNDQQMGSLTNNGHTGDFNSLLEQEYRAGKIKNTFDFVEGKGTDYTTGTTNWSPFAVSLDDIKARNNQPMSAQTAQVSSANGYTPKLASGSTPQYTASQQSAQAWINNPNSGFKGIDSYSANNIDRYNRGEISYDQLQADSNRVGYAIPQQNQATATPNNSTVSGYTAPQDEVTSVRSSSELEKQSGDSLAIERAALKNAIDTQMQSLKNNAAYTNQLTNDSRVLQDSTRTQTANPFGNLGRTSFNEGLIGRQRSIDDSARNSELTNQMNSLTTEIANFDKLSPERQRTIYNELLQLERQFAINQSAVTGDYAGERTLAGSAQDYAQNPNNPSNVGQRIQNQLAQLQLAEYPNQVKQQAALFEQELASGKMSQQAAEYNLAELTNPNSATNQAKALELKMAELEAANLPETQRLELQKLRKQIADIGKVHYKPQTAAEKEYDEAQVRKINAEILKIENGGSSTADYTSNPVFTGAYADANSGGLTVAEITKDGSSIISELGKKAYDELLSAARAYEKGIVQETGF